MKPPSETQLKRVERELRRQPPGAQRALGEGVYMRIDKAGGRRFLTLRDRKTGAPGGTYDSWQQAVDGRARLETAATVGPSAEDAARATAAEIRNWPIADYVEYSWWPLSTSCATSTPSPRSTTTAAGKTSSRTWRASRSTTSKARRS
jgi:hypothetical protein